MIYSISSSRTNFKGSVPRTAEKALNNAGNHLYIKDKTSLGGAVMYSAMTLGGLASGVSAVINSNWNELACSLLLVPSGFLAALGDFQKAIGRK